MCFWQWLVTNREVISMFANIATVFAIGFAARALYLNAKAIKIQKESSQRDLFHKISSEINIIFTQQKDYEEQGEKSILNWYQRLINAFEYYAFFVNSGHLSGKMATFYRKALISYVDWAKDYPEAEKFFKNQEKGLLCEIREYYERYSGNHFPF